MERITDVKEFYQKKVCLKVEKGQRKCFFIAIFFLPVIIFLEKGNFGRQK